MRCPFCGNIDTQVKDSRPAEDHVSIRRRRFCPACGGRFTTFERVQLRELVIVKKSGRKVPFEREKLQRSFEIALRKRPVERDRIYIAVTAQAAQGMTLRDYFAAKAMPIAFDSQALLAAGEELGAKQGVALCAKMAWAIADAMLAAREVQS